MSDSIHIEVSKVFECSNALFSHAKDHFCEGVSIQNVWEFKYRESLYDIARITINQYVMIIYVIYFAKMYL